MISPLRSGLAPTFTRLASTTTKFTPLKRSFCSSRVTTQETEKLAKNTLQTMKDANAANASYNAGYSRGYQSGERKGPKTLVPLLAGAVACASSCYIGGQLIDRKLLSRKYQ